MTNTTPTTTVQETVLSAEHVTERQVLLTSALMDARMGRYLPFLYELVISHRALTEQVRVLRKLLHNAMAYIPNEYDDELALRNSIADALAALEGSGE